MIETVNQFLEKVAQDAQLQEEVAKAMESENDRQAVAELAAKRGYKFMPEELGQAIQELQNAAASSGELNEEELEAVAGGCFVLPIKGDICKLPLPFGPIKGGTKW